MSAAQRWAEAQRRIAEAMAPGGAPVPRTLGAITLTDTQHDTACRAAAVLRARGVVLLGDATGSGKTYIALAAAAALQAPRDGTPSDAGSADDAPASLLVIAPASLRHTWHQALQRTGHRARFVTVEQLSRAGAAYRAADTGGRAEDRDDRARDDRAGNDHDTPEPSEPHTAPIVLIDEAHHLRTRGTRRHAAATALCRGARVLLLSATPVHNHDAELRGQLALALGPDADDLSESAVAELLVRGCGPSIATPACQRHPTVALRDDPDLVRQLAALPAPLPPRDGGSARGLWRMALLRAWCSSAAALEAMLQRARLAALALRDCLQAGRHPTRQELRSWGGDDGQLAWPELMVAAASATSTAGESLDAHLQALDAALARVRMRHDIDRERVDALLTLRRAHPGAAILACAQYESTVRALWAALRGTPGVALLSARGGQIASGPLGREAVLARFAPQAQGAPTPPARERITLLLATDLVSEGLNLQDATVLVHLDQPWTPARLAQREGRLLRPGAAADLVHVHRLEAPAAAATLLALEARMARKRGAMQRADAPGSDAARIAALLKRWRDASTPDQAGPDSADPPPHTRTTRPAMLAVDTREPVSVALIADPAPRLLARVARGPFTPSPAVVVRALTLLDAAAPCDRPVPDSERRRALRAAAALAAARVAAVHRPHAARAYRQDLRQARAALAGADASQRARLAQAASARLAALSQDAARPDLARPEASRSTPARSPRLLLLVSSFRRATPSPQRHPP
jgi:superfamily II DNA or RNA helicase